MGRTTPETIKMQDTVYRLEAIFKEQDGDRPQGCLAVTTSPYGRRRVRGVLPDPDGYIGVFGRTRYVGIVEAIDGDTVSYHAEEHFPNTKNRITRFWQFTPEDGRISFTESLTQEGRTTTSESLDVTNEPRGNTFIRLVSGVQEAFINYSGSNEGNNHTFTLQDLQD